MTNRRYALRDVDDSKSGTKAARAYLRFQDANVDLRGNYLAIASAAAEQLERGVPCKELMGFLDAPKLKSSLQLFLRASQDGFDQEIHEACARALRALDEEGSGGSGRRRSGSDRASDGGGRGGRRGSGGAHVSGAGGKREMGRFPTAVVIGVEEWDGGISKSGDEEESYLYNAVAEHTTTL